MQAEQLAFTVTGAPFPPPRGEHLGEAVLVTPRHAGGLDDRVIAGHAAFAWRAAMHVLARPGGGCLRYKSHRPTAVFAQGVASRAQLGDRITRCWDGAVFEVVAAYRDGGRLCCDLVALDGRRH